MLSNEYSDENREIHAKFLPFFKISQITLEKLPPFLILRIRAFHWKKYQFFVAEMGTSMDVRFGRECQDRVGYVGILSLTSVVIYFTYELIIRDEDVCPMS